MELSEQKCGDCGEKVLVPSNRPDLQLKPGVRCVLKVPDVFSGECTWSDEHPEAYAVHDCTGRRAAATKKAKAKPQGGSSVASETEAGGPAAD